MRFRLHRSGLGVGVLVAVIGLAGCQAETDEPTLTPTATATVAPSSAPSAEASTAPSSTSAAEGEQVSVFDLRAGDCFSADAEQLGDTVTVVDCEQPHLYEAYFVFDHEAGPNEPYPGDEAVLEYADEACQPPFEEFVDFDYAESIWYITSVTPSEETWADGDREIVCTVNQQDANEEPIEVSASAEGAAE